MDRPRKPIVVFIIAAALIPQVVKLLLPMGNMLLAFFPDDLFYYLKPARNIAAGLGSTFDGINFTNGYHPLWMLICAAVARIVSDPIVYLYSMLALNLLVVLVLSIRIVALFRSQMGVWIALLVVILINGQRKCAAGVFSGLETPLYILLVLETTNLLIRMSWRNKWHIVGLGALGGLAFLARTSFVLFVPAACSYLLYRRICSQDRPTWRRLVLAATPCLVLSVPYLAWNYHHTGFLQPISGLTKNLIYAGGFTSMAAFKEGLLSLAGNSGVVLLPWPLSAPLAILILVSIAIVWRHRKWRAVVQDPRLIVLALFAAAEALYYFVNYGASIYTWHMAPVNVAAYLLAASLIAVALSCLDRRAALSRVITGLCLCVGLTAPWQSMYYYKAFQYPPLTYDAAVWMRDNLPPDAKIGVWNAGVVGYFSERTIVNLDGVMNGRELYDYRLRGATYQYVLDNELGYLADYSMGPPWPERSVLKDRLKRIHSREYPFQDSQGNPRQVCYYVWKIE